MGKLFISIDTESRQLGSNQHKILIAGDIIHFMKIIATLIIGSIFSATAQGQSSFDKTYSTDICNCFDSLKQEKALNENSFPLCFQITIEKNPSAFIKECLTLYGDTTEETGNKFGKEIAERMSISLVSSCKTYFIMTDSLRYDDYKNLNKDSLKNQVRKMETVTISKRDKDFYDGRGLLYFQLGQYDKSLQDINIVLGLDPNDVKNIFTKAWIDEIKGNYPEAITLYERAEHISNIKAFEIFIAIAKRKKNGS